MKRRTPAPQPTKTPIAPRRSWYRGPKGDVNDPECAELVRKYRALVAALEAK